METYLPWSLFTSVKSNIDLYYYDCFSCMTEMYSLFSCYSNRGVLFVKYLVEFIELLLWVTWNPDLSGNGGKYSIKT